MFELDYALPVHDPGFPLSPFELLTCEIIVASADLARVCAALMHGRRSLPQSGIEKLLMLRALRSTARFVDHCDLLGPLLKGAAARGLTLLQEETGPDAPLQLPLLTDFQDGLPTDLYPLSWISVLVRDPLDDPQPFRLEPVVWRILGLLESLHGRLCRWLEARRKGEQAETILLYQLDQVLAHASNKVYHVRGEFLDGAKQAAVFEAETGCTQARLDIPLGVLPLDPNLLLVGADHMVPAWAKLGLDARGRQLLLSLFTSQLVLAIGGRGWGKSYLGRLIAECLHLYLPGLNQLPYALRSATFEVDYNLGHGRRQMLRGFFPNTNAQQLAQLRDYFGCTATNAAFRQGILRCLPESLAGLRHELSAYRERGLVIEPVELGPQNLIQLGWEAILGAAFQKGADRPAYADHLAAFIGYHGDKLMPADLIAEIQHAPEFARVRGGLIRQLLPLVDLVRRGAEVRDDLKQGCPVFYLLECQHAPESFLLGLLVALMQGLAAPTGRPEDEIMLWLFCDELNKLLDLPVVAKLLLAMAKELRHRLVSLYLGGQTATGLSQDLLGLVSVFFLFHLSNRAGFTPLRELEYFQPVSGDILKTLERGQPLVGAEHSTDPLLRQMAQVMWLRPTLINAGGESLTLR